MVDFLNRLWELILPSLLLRDSCDYVFWIKKNLLNSEQYLLETKTLLIQTNSRYEKKFLTHLDVIKIGSDELKVILNKYATSNLREKQWHLLNSLFLILYFFSS
jgi:hypothetical protein